jgi:hypothetical protein
MNCLECQELLQRRLDGEPPGDRAELDRHLAACPECRERHAAAALLGEGLKLLPRPAPPADLAERVAARVLRDRAARLRRWRIGAGLVLAASLLVAVVAGYRWLNPASAEPGLLASAWPPEPPPDKGPSLREGVQEARAALAAAAARLADRLREQGGVFEVSAAPLQFISTDAVPPMGPMAQPLESAARGLKQTGEGVSTGVQTVGGSTRRALNYFFRKMPPLAAKS